MCREHLEIRRGYRISGLLLEHETAFTCEGMNSLLYREVQMLTFYKQRKCNILLLEDGPTSLRIEGQEISSSGFNLPIY
jgi:hypothetical protein